jgi:glycerophosphoryl diester phosphodiesterase
MHPATQCYIGPGSMKKSLIIPFIIAISFTATFCFGQIKTYTLIAHRGGVVDSSFTENGISALKSAVRDQYQMIETDVRVTRDGVLIANHDADFKRYYGVEKKVLETDWQEVKMLKSERDGDSPLLLEDILKFCKKNKLGIMLDNKIAGMDSAVFNKLITLLDRYDLRKGALMIGTDESTEFFTGKIRLSCSRVQLESNMKRPDYKVSDYFFFERAFNLSKTDVEWAKSNDIMTVAAINKYHYRKSADMMADAERDCKNLIQIGVTSFQIDSEFHSFFVGKK